MNFYKVENKKFSEENDRLRAENIGYWLENYTLKQENEELKAEIERLKEPKVILNIDITSEELAKHIVKKLNKNEEHKCTPECFERHVLKPIQSDIYKKFGDDSVTRSYNISEMVKFVETWRIKLIKEYSFIKDLYTIDFGELTAVYK